MQVESSCSFSIRNIPFSAKKINMKKSEKTASISSESPPGAEGLVCGQDGRLRCFWVGNDPLYQRYHDEEWSRPPNDDRHIFEKLCLEGFQAGLSWATILHKREALRRAFNNFDFRRLSLLNETEQAEWTERLMQDKTIIRHSGKIAAVFGNACAAVQIVAGFGSLSDYLRQFMPPATERQNAVSLSDYKQKTSSPQAETLAKDLKKRGFRFIGSTSAYAFMQSMGMVNDHIAGCFCRDNYLSW